MLKGNPAAGLWVRFAAHVIDSTIFCAVAAVGLFLFGVLHGLFRFGDTVLGLLFLAVCAVLWAGNWLYYFLWHWNGGQTLGKRWLGLMVVGEEHSLLTFRQANLRWLGYHLSYLTLGIGFVMAGFRKGGRALHDGMAGTKVVHVDPRRLWLEAGAVLLLGWVPFVYPLIVANAAGSAYRFYFVKTAESPESATRNALGLLRESIYRYRMDYARFPERIDGTAFDGKEGYASAFPAVTLPRQGHAESFEVVRGPRVLEDSGRWVYDSEKGQVYIDCSHTDVNGTTVYSW